MTIPVHYATDRKLEGSTYGKARSAQMNYGTAFVTIPPNHSLGAIESPSVISFSAESPLLHVVIAKKMIQGEASYFKLIALEGSGFKGTAQSALLFVHGYNVTFNDAAKRTAQLAADLSFPGPALMFSWPSQGSVPGYGIDEGNIEWATPDIKKNIENILTKSSIKNLYIIAHSMGNRGVTKAIIELIRERPELAPRIKELILAAPDIDADIFKRDIAPGLLKAKQQVTLYVSAKDLPLRLSKMYHSASRVGETNSSIVAIAGMETIDATNIDNSFLGHSYIGEERTMLEDLVDLFNGKRASERIPRLKSVSTAQGHYYLIRK
jgi:esterase/lipase superfamily enzyme